MIDGGACRYTPNCMIHTGERREPYLVRRGMVGHSGAILTPDEVKTIRRQYDDGVPRKQLARRYGISPSTVQDIGQRRTWKWVT